MNFSDDKNENKENKEEENSLNNPYISSDASMLVDSDENLANDPILQIFSRQKLERGENNQIIYEQTKIPRTPIILQSDILNGMPRPEFTKVNPLNLLNTYINSNIEKIDECSLKLPVKSKQLLNFELKEMKFGFDFIEPIICTAFLFDGEKIISEYWHFLPDQSLPFLISDKSFQSIKTASFQYSEVSPTVHLIILFKRIVQLDRGSAVNKYYEKQSQKNLEAAKVSIIMSFPRISDIFSTFCVTAAPLTQIITSSSGYTFPDPIIYQESVTKNNPITLNEIINQIKTQKQCRQIPIKLTLTMSIKSVDTLNNIVNLIPNIVNVYTEPNTTFRHQVTFKLNSISLKKISSDKKARNIFAVFSLQEGIHSPRLPLMVNPVTKKNVPFVTSSCYYHDKNPSFDDLFICNLPGKLPENLYLFAFIYHCVVNPKDGSNKEDRIYIGFSAIPVIKNGKPVQNGTVISGISFDHEIVEDDQNNFIEGELMYHSTIYPNNNDPRLFELFDKLRNGTIDLDLMRSIDPSILRKYLLQAFVLIARLIPEQHILGVSAVMELAHIVLSVYPQVSQVLGSYAHSFFSKIDGVLEGWNEITRSIPADLHGASRKDVNASKCLFELGKYNYCVEFTKTFGKSLALLSGNGLIQAKTLIEDYAFFIVNADKAIECIEIMSDILNDISSDSEILCHFYNCILSTTLFKRLVFETNQLQKICLRAKEFNSQRQIQKVFGLIAGRAYSLPREEQTKYADKLLDLVLLLSPISEVPFANDQDLHPVITLFLWLLSASSDEKMKEFIKSVDNKNEIFKSLHFILHRLRDGVGTRRFTMLEQLERRYSVKQRQKAGTVKRNLVHATNARKTTTYIQKSRELALCAELSSLRLILSLDIKDCICEVCRLYYHILTQDLAVNAIPEVIPAFIHFVHENINEIREMSQFTNLEQEDNEESESNFKPKQLITISISKHIQKCLEMTSIWESDFSEIADIPELIQAIAQSDLSLIGELRPQSLADFVADIKSIEKSIKEEELQDMKAENYMKLLEKCSKSSEAQIVVLSRMVTFHQENKNIYEEIECRKQILSLMQTNDSKLIPQANALCNLCINEKLYELGDEILTKFSNLEENNKHESLKNTIDAAIQNLSNSKERVFAPFFYVKFTLGEKVDSYIYREKCLTNLYNFIKILEADYPDAKIIKSSSDKKDDPSKLYIEVEFVEPYNKKHENKNEFQKHYYIDHFYYESPFTKLNNKSLQGSIEDQYLKKTIIESEFKIPYFIKRVKVKSISEKIIEPISVSLHMIQSRTVAMREAEKTKDLQQIQQLLRGNLMSQVNIGPLAIAETFFKTDNPKVPKLKQAFHDFITATKDILEIHRTFDNEQAISFQSEFDQEFEKLSVSINALSE